MKDSRGRLPSGEAPHAQRSVENTQLDANSKRFIGYAGTWGGKVLEDLRACRLGVRGFYRRAKSEVYRSEMQGGKFLT